MRKRVMAVVMAVAMALTAVPVMADEENAVENESMTEVVEEDSAIRTQDGAEETSEEPFSDGGG